MFHQSHLLLQYRQDASHSKPIDRNYLLFGRIPAIDEERSLQNKSKSLLILLYPAQTADKAYTDHWVPHGDHKIVIFLGTSSE
jgi:hypothetical protein